jgi:hypothetical protein
MLCWGLHWLLQAYCRMLLTRTNSSSSSSSSRTNSSSCSSSCSSSMRSQVQQRPGVWAMKQLRGAQLQMLRGPYRLPRHPWECRAAAAAAAAEHLP